MPVPPQSGQIGQDGRQRDRRLPGRRLGVRAADQRPDLGLRAVGEQRGAGRRPDDEAARPGRDVEAHGGARLQDVDVLREDRVARGEDHRAARALRQVLEHAHEAAVAHRPLVEPRAEERHTGRRQEAAARRVVVEVAEPDEALQEHRRRRLRDLQPLGDLGDPGLALDLVEHLQDLEHPSGGLHQGRIRAGGIGPHRQVRGRCPPLVNALTHAGTRGTGSPEAARRETPLRVPARSRGDRGASPARPRCCDATPDRRLSAV